MKTKYNKFSLAIQDYYLLKRDYSLFIIPYIINPYLLKREPKIMKSPLNQKVTRLLGPILKDDF